MKDAIIELTGGVLQRRYCDAQGIPTFGHELCPFVVVDERFKELWVFGTRQLEVVETDFEIQSQSLLTEDLQAQGGEVQRRAERHGQVQNWKHHRDRL